MLTYLGLIPAGFVVAGVFFYLGNRVFAVGVGGLVLISSCKTFK
jgi:hypothetical protein